MLRFNAYALLALSACATPAFAAPYNTAEDFFNSTDYIAGSALPEVLDFLDFTLPAGSIYTLIVNSLGTTIYANSITLAGDLTVTGGTLSLVANEISFGGTLNALNNVHIVDSDAAAPPGPSGSCATGAGVTISISGSGAGSLCAGSTLVGSSRGGSIGPISVDPPGGSGSAVVVSVDPPGVNNVIGGGVLTVGPIALTPVPLPAAAWLLLGALPVLARRRRERPVAGRDLSRHATAR